MTKKILLVIIFVLGLVYLILPGPSKIEDFPSISNSLKSKEPGDTYQNPNIAADYSFYNRDQITKFYIDFYDHLNFLGIRIPSVHLNHPPEEAYQYIRDQQVSTFLEEYTYPLRDSFFVNGYEPKIENQIRKKPPNFFADTIHQNGVFYNSKTTLRFYPTDTLSRLFIYIGIWTSFFLLFKVFIKALRQ
jgi:hypothetical protein